MNALTKRSLDNSQFILFKQTQYCFAVHALGDMSGTNVFRTATPCAPKNPSFVEAPILPPPSNGLNSIVMIGALTPCLLFVLWIGYRRNAIALMQYMLKGIGPLVVSDAKWPANPYIIWGGGGRKTVKYSEISQYCTSIPLETHLAASKFTYGAHIKPEDIPQFDLQPGCLILAMPMPILTPHLLKDDLKQLAVQHNVSVPSKALSVTYQAKINAHVCEGFACASLVSIFLPVGRKVKRTLSLTAADKLHHIFPPAPAPLSVKERIIQDFCAASTPSQFVEAGCKVCGKLTPLRDLKHLENMDFDDALLINPSVTRVERSQADQAIKGVDGPVYASGCSKACRDCFDKLQKGIRPKYALANGLWLGDVPDTLLNLTFAEKMMIAKVRHNRCVVRVASGRGKLSANAIMFANPTLKVYLKLPPSKDELSQVLAFVFVGSIRPTEETFRRTPMLVRREKVLKALEWLKLNHSGYTELEISVENLETYELQGVPVTIDWNQTKDGESTENPLSKSVHEANDTEELEGTESGPCSFRIHGMTEDAYDTMSVDALKAKALTHLSQGGKVLGIGHDEKPQSTYDNPMAYPAMFPWLFPYGYGGLGNDNLPSRLGELSHKAHLLMYYDKRFQTDLYFPLIAFNHDQIKCGTTGSFLLAKRQKFRDIADRVLSVSTVVLADISNRMGRGMHVVPETEEEKKCFDVLSDLDHVGGHVKGSISSKKYMRNEIWSLVNHLGAPSWFITFSPADVKHPICLYYAGSDIEFSPELKSSDERQRLISSNPVAAARFFNVMVTLFLKHILGVGSAHEGLYGKTSGYYGTVEQQGRLTLHLHMLVWIENSLSPQDIRDRLQDEPACADFTTELIAYLEGSHMGEFLTGTLEEVRARIPKVTKKRELHDLFLEDGTGPTADCFDYRDPTQTLPQPPPKDSCTCVIAQDAIESADVCQQCSSLRQWRKEYQLIVDDILARSNIHSCQDSYDARGQPKSGYVKGCRNKEGVCTARFPREKVLVTHVDPDDGSLKMKKLEVFMNTVSCVVTFLLRCNSDVSSLLSGTAIKAVVLYVTNYITKPSLKTHHVFSSMAEILGRSVEVLGDGVKSRHDNARKLILQVVNSLTSHMEIGSPMASMYLLNHPDHYTSHMFKVFWWKSYVTWVRHYWSKDVEMGRDMEVDAVHDIDDVVLNKEGEVYVGHSNVDDYSYRPNEFQEVCLFHWIQLSSKRRIQNKEMQGLLSGNPLPRNWYRFTENHGQYDTHIVKCDLSKPDHERPVPNFVGGALPRRDSGDEEYYSATMLTLFAPWRSGSDLKLENESWVEAFKRFNFLPWQRHKMDCFNLKYECHDANDDYHAQLKLKTKQARTYNKMMGLTDEFMNDSNVNDTVDFDYAEHEYMMEDLDAVGENERTRKSAMNDAKVMVTQAGWLAAAKGMPKTAEDFFIPETKLSPAQWKATVAAEKAAAMELKARNMPAPQNTAWKPIRPIDINRVEEMDGIAALGHSFQMQTAKNEQEKVDVMQSFELNRDQSRAFSIIADHACNEQGLPLKMYLGGMGGTGKSRVIQALIQFFRTRNEEHRFLILAPTGTAAALLGGSTYHSVLGLGGKRGDEGGRNETGGIRHVRGKLMGVNYIFIDEVSMLSCSNLYQISERLSKGLSNTKEAFGGMNMIFAGDFAQLPPIGGRALFHAMECTTNPRMGVKVQKEIIGKILWMQVTTVVILKENMRQMYQSPEDSAFRRCLENMRYGACTEQDMSYLRSRVVSGKRDHPKLSDARFREVAIITGRNAQKDMINDLGCKRFAEDRRLELHEFVSVDSLWEAPEADPKGKTGKRQSSRRSAQLTQRVKEALWNAPPATSDHMAGTLRLCVGMPVMIKNNDATELCMTKGQVATVAGWDASNGRDGRHVLDTLFVKLDNPPKTINIKGLPENIVPMPRVAETLQCTLPNDRVLTIKRQQVQVLPYFALTDYASQGKTRENNVVDLSNCRSTFSYYTCLSRSATAAGTAILKGFDERVITNGISGYLRQEFRELDLLNEITQAKFEGTLEESVCGEHRNQLLRAYHVVRGDTYDPQGMHPALTWRRNDRPRKPVDMKQGEWSLVGADQVTEEAPGQTQSGQVRKRVIIKKKAGIAHEVQERLIVGATNGKRDGDEAAGEGRVRKKPKVSHAPGSDLGAREGLRWDAYNFSCVFDSVFTIMWNLWLENVTGWSMVFAEQSVALQLLSDGFLGRVLDKQQTLESSRDRVRQHLNAIDSNHFPFGERWSSLDALPGKIFSDESFATGNESCGKCGHNMPASEEWSVAMVVTKHNSWAQIHGSNYRLSDWFSHAYNYETRRTCPTCFYRLRVEMSIDSIPAMLCLTLEDHRVELDPVLTFTTEKGQTSAMRLTGVVYSGGNHFTCTFIDRAGISWFHDGMTTGGRCLEWKPVDVRVANDGRRSVMALYSKEISE